MKIYTKTGDTGTTSLIGGERVSKCDRRVEAYGTVDELAAHIALLCDTMREHGGFVGIVGWIEEIQDDLMYVETMLAAGGGKKVPALSAEAVKRLEDQIYTMSEGLAPAKYFIIPGGHPIVSMSHICRTVCRRAERETVRIPDEYAVPQLAVQYLNRLSDWLYVAGRKAVEILCIKDRYWNP